MFFFYIKCKADDIYRYNKQRKAEWVYRMMPKVISIILFEGNITYWRSDSYQ